MLDHVFGDAIGALRSALEMAMLERQAVEERFTTDVLLGDTRWETAYSLPGEGHPPRVQADVTLLWPTWSQTAYRSWYLSGELGEVPAIETEVVFRAQGLDAPPDPAAVARRMPSTSPPTGRTALEMNGGPTVETSWNADLSIATHAIEVSYEGSFELHIEALADGNDLDELFNMTGGWISSTLVSLGDVV